MRGKLALVLVIILALGVMTNETIGGSRPMVEVQRRGKLVALPVHTGSESGGPESGGVTLARLRGEPDRSYHARVVALVALTQSGRLTDQAPAGAFAPQMHHEGVLYYYDTDYEEFSCYPNTMVRNVATSKVRRGRKPWNIQRLYVEARLNYKGTEVDFNHNTRSNYHRAGAMNEWDKQTFGCSGYEGDGEGHHEFTDPRYDPVVRDTFDSNPY